MGRFVIYLTMLWGGERSSASTPEAVLSPRQRILQISHLHQQKRRLAQIAEEQKNAESRNFAPEKVYESFTLTDADPVQNESLRHPTSQ